MPGASAESRRGFRGAAAALLVVALLLGLLGMFREPLGRALLPDSALAGQLAAGDAALTAGALAAAAGHYRAAAAREPDHPRVHAGLEAVAQAALVQVDRALASGRPEAAADALGLAARLGAPGDALRQRQAALAAATAPPVEQILQRALAGESSDPAAALADYLSVLAREPGHPLALDGRQRLLQRRLDLALAAFEADPHGARDFASGELAAVQALDPGHLGLPLARQRLEASGMPAAVVAARPRVPAEAAAEALRWRGIAEEALGRGEWARAGTALQHARRLDPGHEALGRLERRLADARP
jgi:hypothetical protein